MHGSHSKMKNKTKQKWKYCESKEAERYEKIQFAVGETYISRSHAGRRSMCRKQSRTLSGFRPFQLPRGIKWAKRWRCNTKIHNSTEFNRDLYMGRERKPNQTVRQKNLQVIWWQRMKFDSTHLHCNNFKHEFNLGDEILEGFRENQFLLRRLWRIFKGAFCNLRYCYHICVQYSTMGYQHIANISLYSSTVLLQTAPRTQLATLNLFSTI